MTQETLDEANHIVKDIETLRQVKKSLDKRHWVSVCTADYKEDRCISSDILYHNFKMFVNENYDLLQKKLEEL